MRIGLFYTCLIDIMRPEIGLSVVKLLQSAGCEVAVPESQTCCGQPAYNSGDRRTARQLAEKFVLEFEAFDYVVIPSGSCGGMVRVHFADLFADDPGWRARMKNLASRVFELTEFLDSVVKSDTLSAAARSKFQGQVTYHDSCCGLRELGVCEQPRALLRKVPGLTLIEMKDSRNCCGFGGTFALKFGSISSAIVDDKCANIKDSGADTVVLGDLGCMLNIEGRLRRSGDSATRVLHVAQVLAGDC